MSELMYHPLPGGDEFVELKNITATNVALFDPANLMNTWQFDGIGFTFRTNVMLAPGAFVLLVPSDPTVFRA